MPTIYKKNLPLKYDSILVDGSEIRVLIETDKMLCRHVFIPTGKSHMPDYEQDTEPILYCLYGGGKIEITETSTFIENLQISEGSIVVIPKNCQAKLINPSFSIALEILLINVLDN